MIERIHVPGLDPLQPGKLVCIGRNYARHAAEMRADVPDVPMIFLKPASSLVASGHDIVFPALSVDVHHEVELVAVIGEVCRHVSPDRALQAVAGYAVGLDMTARDLQSAAKKKGAPWSVSKGFDTFAPLGAPIPAASIADPQRLEIRLSVNGEVRQSGSTSDMIFTVAELIAYASSIFTLLPGDLLFTGTPEGVGPIRPGDNLMAELPPCPPLSVGVVSERLL